MTQQLLAFLPAISLMVLIPGANNLLVLRTAAEAGRRAAGATALGTSTGIVSWSVAVACGLGSVVAAAPGGLRLVGGVGSALMIALGVWAAVPRRAARPTHSTGSRGFLTGFAVCVANPRTPVLAVSLLPQYATADSPLTSTVLLGVVWAVLSVAVNVVGITVATGRLTPQRAAVVQGVGAVVVAGVGAVGLARAIWG